MERVAELSHVSFRRPPSSFQAEGEDVVLVLPVVDPLEFKAEEILKKGQKGFEKWLKGLSIEKLEAIVKAEKAEEGEAEAEKARASYLKWVKEHETAKVCSSCRWLHGCETCSYEHALRYVVRHRQPAKWWLRRKGEVLRAAAGIRYIMFYVWKPNKQA